MYLLTLALPFGGREMTWDETAGRGYPGGGAPSSPFPVLRGERRDALHPAGFQPARHIGDPHRTREPRDREQG